MTPSEWDTFVAEKFDDVHDTADFQAWLRLRDCSYLDFDRPRMDRFFDDWSRSKRRGKHSAILDRKRRQQFGPGKFHAATSAGVFLNKKFVKGWRGINPENP